MIVSVAVLLITALVTAPAAIVITRPGGSGMSYLDWTASMSLRQLLRAGAIAGALSLVLIMALVLTGVLP